jgi:hypothetical protein
MRLPRATCCTLLLSAVLLMPMATSESLKLVLLL